MSSFTNKVVLITGGADGIGYLMGLKALQKGTRHLIIWDINSERLDQAVQQLSEKGFSVKGHTVDVSDPDQVLAEAEKVLSTFNSIDILINNAGVIVGKLFQEHSTTDIARTVGVNQLAPMYVTRAFLPAMLEQENGHIVTISSAVGLTPNPGMVVYASSKWGAVGWAESLRLEVTRNHPSIHFTNVMPSYIGTKMFTGVTPPRLMPLLDPEVITDKIIHAIETNRTTLKAPWLVKLTTLVRGVLPASWYDFVAEHVFKVYASMDTFKGKQDE
ncbi:MAG: SDR family oxidoreductase [Balneolaceae bacterium]|nr:SDR family oxidoreductase [Balneolaceae bacterium]